MPSADCRRSPTHPQPESERSSWVAVSTSYIEARGLRQGPRVVPGVLVNSRVRNMGQGVQESASGLLASYMLTPP
jgi:hypothetical protein